MTRSSELAAIELPDFGLPETEPTLPDSIYQERLGRLNERAKDKGYDTIVVYADREHFANLAYLTGYDPRFEEALLLIDVEDTTAKPTLLVGLEGKEYVNISPIRSELEVELFPSFSLLGMDRSDSPSLQSLLRQAGITAESTVGVAGWKYFTAEETSTPQTTIEIPAYIVDALRTITNGANAVQNATKLFMHSNHGMRTQENEVDQLARFEFSASYSSQAIRDILLNLEPGMTEYEAVQSMDYTGIPLSCHLMLSSGSRAHMGLPSPTMRTIQRGDPLTTAVGLRGALNARAGFVVEDETELPDEISDYVDTLVAPYFEAIVAWYETVGIGVEGRTLYDCIHSRIGDSFFGVELNPGHLIHLDEWVDSPIYEGSTETLRSGMALQVDTIPATGTDYFTTNIEDGIALADEELRAAFKAEYPAAWNRIQARRSFMIDEIGIDLSPEVLPFSNIPAYLPPYLLSPETVLRTA